MTADPRVQQAAVTNFALTLRVAQPAQPIAIGALTVGKIGPPNRGGALRELGLPKEPLLLTYVPQWRGKFCVAEQQPSSSRRALGA